MSTIMPGGHAKRLAHALLRSMKFQVLSAAKRHDYWQNTAGAALRTSIGADGGLPLSAPTTCRSQPRRQRRSI
jgi:hypothetical protein